MTSRTITVTAPNGLHARPTGELVKMAKAFAPIKVTLATDVKLANAASMISVIALGLKNGSKVEVRAEGPDSAAEEKAVCEICEFIESIKD